MTYEKEIHDAEVIISVYQQIIIYNKQYMPKNDNSLYEEKIELLKTFIAAIQELQKYQKLGTYEELEKAVLKQRAKKPILIKNPVDDSHDIPVCPTCKSIMVRTEIYGETIDEHCVSCGQFIDWGKEDI